MTRSHEICLQWAFSEAALLLLRASAAAKAYVARLTQRHGKGKALGILSHRLGRTVYFMLRRGDYFDEQRFLSGTFVSDEALAA